MSNFSKLDALLHETHSKILLVLRLPRLDMYRSTISLGNKKNSGVRGCGGRVGGTKLEKRGVGNIGGLHKIGV